MRQEVTIGSDILDYFIECDMDVFEPYSFGPFFLQLKRDNIMWNDKLYESMYDKSLELMANEGDAISYFWDKHLTSLNRKEVEDVKQVKFEELTKEDCIEYGLLQISKDKIWLKLEKNVKRLKFRDNNARKGKSVKIIKANKKRYGYLKLPISFNDYSKPDPSDGNNILRLDYEYEHDPDDYFPFNNFIESLLTDAKKITIKEPYIVHMSGNPKLNLEFIFSLVPESTPIQIITNKKEDYPFFKNKVRCSACKYYPFEEEFNNHIKERHLWQSPHPTPIMNFDPINELSNELKSKYNNLLFKFEKHHERRIITDEFKITLGAGLSTYRDNKVVYSDSSFRAEKK